MSKNYKEKLSQKIMSENSQQKLGVKIISKNYEWKLSAKIMSKNYQQKLWPSTYINDAEKLRFIGILAYSKIYSECMK